MKNLMILFVLFLACKANAQIRSSYCECEIKGVKISSVTDDKRVNLESSYSNGMINIKITNNTIDTIFIFKSYFDNDLSKSRYLYRYNRKHNQLNISYAPLLPYIFTKYSDKIILENRILKDYQVVYDFYKIPPYYEYSFNVNALAFQKMDEFIEDFDISKLNKFEKIRTFRNVKLNKNPSILLSIAYYLNIKRLCDSNAYYQEELNFNQDTQDFKVLKSNIILN